MSTLKTLLGLVDDHLRYRENLLTSLKELIPMGRVRLDAEFNVYIDFVDIGVYDYMIGVDNLQVLDLDKPVTSPFELFNVVGDIPYGFRYNAFVLINGTTKTPGIFKKLREIGFDVESVGANNADCILTYKRTGHSFYNYVTFLYNTVNLPDIVNTYDCGTDVDKFLKVAAITYEDVCEMYKRKGYFEVEEFIDNCI